MGTFIGPTWYKNYRIMSNFLKFVCGSFFFSLTSKVISISFFDAREAIITRLSLTPGVFLAWYSSWNVTVVRTHLEDS